MGRPLPPGRRSGKPRQFRTKEACGAQHFPAASQRRPESLRALEIPPMLQKERKTIPAREEMEEQRTVGERMSKPKGGHLPAPTGVRLVWKDMLRPTCWGERRKPPILQRASTGPGQRDREENGHHGDGRGPHLKLFLSSRPPAGSFSSWTRRTSPSEGRRTGGTHGTGQGRGAVACGELPLWERVRCCLRTVHKDGGQQGQRPGVSPRSWGARVARKERK